MCTHPNFGIRVLDKMTGAITVKFIGSYDKYHGKYNFSFDKVGSGLGDFVLLPCGQCMECRIKKAREWSIRLLHEKQLHEKSCFLTLTYNDENLPKDKGLHVDHVQKFLKDYRHELDRKQGGKKIRFFCAGEYGSKSFRPHYHLIIFGDDFTKDRLLYGVSHGHKYYISDTLKRLWPYGYHIIGSVTNDSVMYVARYVTKKITGSISAFYYDGIKPEFSTMSRRPGIAHDWLMKHSQDIYNYDKCYFKGLELRPPAYYDRLFSVLHPEEFCVIKDKRSEMMEANKEDLIKKIYSSGNVKNFDDLESYFAGKAEIANKKISKVKGYEKL